MKHVNNQLNRARWRWLKVIAFGLFMGVIALIWYQSSLRPVADQATPQQFVVEPGQSLVEISQNLKRQKLIRSSLGFKIYVLVSGLSRKLQAGHYQISAAESSKEIAKKLTTGFSDVWVTIPEGLRVEEVADKLIANLPINRQEFLQNAKEGYMFPDTYRVPFQTTAAQFAQLMLDNFNQRVDANLRQQMTEAGLNLDQVIILASLVEREVKFADDRPIVAGILLKRWRAGMPLEVDATVQYALGFDPNQKTYWKKNLTVEDLAIDSPYNTRKYPGLPPGPICNPGLASIKAVINPRQTDYWYYVSDAAGRIYYAKTLDEHIRNIKQHLSNTS